MKPMANNPTPTVSIVLPTYNGQAFLRTSIESCLAQENVDLELIIIDDGSTDDTAGIVRSFNDERIKYLRLEQNQGHIAALNKGFSLAKGEFLTWTSDDNYYAPKAIATMVKVLATEPNVDFVYAAYSMVDPNGIVLRMGRTQDPKYLDEDNCVGGCFLYRRRVYETIGDFNSAAFLAEDYEYWLRVRAKFKMKKIDSKLYFYREHPRSLTGVHKEEKVQRVVESVRDRFIPSWKREYFYGRKAYNNNDIAVTQQHVWRSFKENPWFSPTWRLLALMYLNHSVIDVVRRIKKLIKR